ncbi:hypothetical protein [Parendozoicomonas sp. Alg238-R29]|uniref:hypothetical protein n=1 Tax=Parendozoicomonas sp. Alg238-R29 TaxID=2993446 RepID=UPI00248EF9E8|nr:hypothetical protein [Parendozoicomonas sp. Alg238-R29]
MKNLNHNQHLRTASCYLIHLQGLLGALIFAAFFIILPTQAYADGGYTVRVIYYNNQHDAYSDSYGIFFDLVDTDNEKDSEGSLAGEELSFNAIYEASERKAAHQLFITAPTNHVEIFPQAPIHRSRKEHHLPSQDSLKYKNSRDISYIAIQRNSQVKDSYTLHLYTETDQKLILLASINASQDIYDELNSKDSFREKWFPNHPTAIKEIPEGAVLTELQYKPERTHSTTSSSYSSTSMRTDSLISHASPSQHPITQTSNPLYVSTFSLTSPSSGYQTQSSSLCDTNLPDSEQRHESHASLNDDSNKIHTTPHLSDVENKNFSSNLTSSIQVAAGLNALHITKESSSLSAQTSYSSDAVFSSSHTSDHRVSCEHINPTYQDSDPLDHSMCSANFLYGLSFILFSQSAGQDQPRWVLNIIEALFKSSTRNLKLNHLFSTLSPAIVRLFKAQPDDLLVRKAISEVFKVFHQPAQALTEWLDIYDTFGINLIDENNRNHSVAVDPEKACNAIQSANLLNFYYLENPHHAVYYGEYGHIPKEVYWSKSVLQRHTIRLQELTTMCAQGLDSLPHLITINGKQVNTVGAIQKLVVNTHNYLPYLFLATYIDYFLRYAETIEPPTKELPTVIAAAANLPQLVVSEYIAQAHRTGLENLPEWLISLITQLQAQALPQQVILQTQRSPVIPVHFKETTAVLNTLNSWESIPKTAKLKKENVVKLARNLSSIKQATDHFQSTSPPHISCTKGTVEFLALLAGGTFTTHKKQPLTGNYKPISGWFSGDKKTWDSQAIQSLDTLRQHYAPHVNAYLMYRAGVRQDAGVKQ